MHAVSGLVPHRQTRPPDGRVFRTTSPCPRGNRRLAESLNAIGYQSGYIGKWHLYGGPKPGFVPPGPHRFGFDHFVGYNRGHQYLDAIFFRDTDQPYHCKRYEPDFQTDHTIEFMDKVVKRDDDAPFLAYVCFGPPHFPMDMPEHWRQMYDPARVTLPHGTPDPELQRQRVADLIANDFDGDADLPERSKTKKFAGMDADVETAEQIRTFVAEYYGMISNVDHNVGRLLDWLDANALADDTIVIFMSDHGDMLGQHGAFCGLKRQAYRGSTHVPFLVRCPSRFQKGKRVTSLVDIVGHTTATLLAACGAEIPSGVHGKSYLSQLEQVADEATRDHVQFELMKMSYGERGDRHVKPERGIRTREWMYMRKQDRACLLFDQINDPHETNNLVDNPAYADIQAELDARVLQNMADTGDGCWNWKCATPPRTTSRTRMPTS